MTLATPAPPGVAATVPSSKKHKAHSSGHVIPPPPPPLAPGARCPPSQLQRNQINCTMNHLAGNTETNWRNIGANDLGAADMGLGHRRRDRLSIDRATDRNTDCQLGVIVINQINCRRAAGQNLINRHSTPINWQVNRAPAPS